VVPVSRPTLFFSAHPIIFFNKIDRATLFSPGGCGLLVQRAKMASVVAIIIEPNCLNSSVGTTHLQLCRDSTENRPAKKRQNHEKNIQKLFLFPTYLP
jgi:hypothetical protein